MLEHRAISINAENLKKESPYALVRIGNTLITSTFNVSLEEKK